MPLSKKAVTALLTSTALTLVDQLGRYGVLVRIKETGIKVKLPSPLPPEAVPLLKQLKQAASRELFDQERAYKLFEEASLRALKIFSPEAWSWAKTEKPVLVEAILNSEQDYARAYRARDMAGCREAVERYEQGFYRLNEAYAQRPPDTCGDKLHPMRDTCRAAGHCLGLTVETDCNFYPVRPGWCEKRINH